MQYRGFESVSAYELAAREHGLTVERVPFRRPGEEGGYFALITASEMDSPTAVKIWVLFPDDESREIMSGVLNGRNESDFFGKLAASGYYPA